MDPFWKLPIELLSEVLIHVEREDLHPASEASPALSCALQSSSNYIARNHTLRDLTRSGDLLQEAMALLTFPTFTVDDIHAHVEHESILGQDLHFPLPENNPGNGRTVAMDQHLKILAAGIFPDPFLSRDTQRIADLDRLCCHIWMFASDYLSKATHSYLPTAYDQLPFERVDITKKGQLSSDYKPSPLSQLTPLQRSRLLQAFIRYELLCKIFRPIAGSKYNRAFVDCGCRRSAKAWKVPQHGPFRRWRWDILHAYKRRRASPRELELLASVREYVMCTFASLTTSGLSRNSIAKDEDLLPGETNDSYRLKIYNIRADLDAELHGEQLDSALATCGLGTLSYCLQLDSDHMNCFAKLLSQDLRKDIQVSEPTTVEGVIVGSDAADWHAGIITRLHRQRAMEVFRKDDGSGGELQFSKEDASIIFRQQMVSRNESLAKAFIKPLKFPYDSWEKIVHGSHRAYGSLEGMMPDLWEQPLPGEEM